MEHFADALIDAIGGTLTVAGLTQSPPSSVSRWRKDLSRSRLNHLLRTARMERPTLDLDELAREHGVTLPPMAMTGEGGEADHEDVDIAAPGDGSPGKTTQVSTSSAEPAAVAA